MVDVKRENVFHNPNYVLLFLGVIVSHIGTTFYGFAVSFYILKITNNNAFIQGLYLAVSGIVYVLASPVGGVLADRWNKVKIIYGTDYLRGIVVIIAALFIYLLKPDLHIVILFSIAIIFNFIGAIFSPASGSIIKYIVDEEQFQQASSYLSGVDSFLAIFGMILGAIFYTLMPIYLLFILIGMFYILSGFSEMFIKYNYIKNETPLTLKFFISDFKDGFKYLLTKKALLYIIIGALFANFFVTPIFNNFPYLISAYVKGRAYLFDHIFEAEYWASLLSIAVSIGTIITSIIYGAKKQKEKFSSSIISGFFMISIITILITFNFFIFIELTDNLNIFLIILLILMFLCGISLIIINIPIATYRYKIVDKDKLAKINSLMAIGSQGLIPIASFLGGVIISQFGLLYLFCFCSLGILATAIFLSLNKPVRSI